MNVTFSHDLLAVCNTLAAGGCFWLSSALLLLLLLFSVSPEVSSCDWICVSCQYKPTQWPQTSSIAHMFTTLFLLCFSCPVSGYGRNQALVFVFLNECETLLTAPFSVVYYPVEVIRWGLSICWKTLPSGGYSNVMTRAFIVLRLSFSGRHQHRSKHHTLKRLHHCSSQVHIMKVQLCDQSISPQASLCSLLREHFLSGYIQIILRSLKPRTQP